MYWSRTHQGDPSEDQTLDLSLQSLMPLTYGRRKTAKGLATDQPGLFIYLSFFYLIITLCVCVGGGCCDHLEAVETRV